MRTKSRRPLIAAAAVLIATLEGIAGPASGAVTPDTDGRTFPEFAPAWYTTTSGPSYVTGNPPAPVILDASGDGLRITYYAPSGGFPGDESPDIDVRQVATLATNSLQFDLTRSSGLAAAFGSTFIDGVVLPDEIGITAEPPITSFSGGAFFVQRPAMSTACDVADPTSYDIQLVLLTANQQKYLVHAHAVFGDRPANELAEQQARCAPVVSEIPVEEDPAPYDDANAAPNQYTAPPAYNWLPLIAIVGGVALVAFLVRRFHIKSKLKSAAKLIPRQAAAKHDDYGNPVTTVESEQFGDNDAPDNDGSSKGSLKDRIRGVQSKVFGEPLPRDES